MSQFPDPARKHAFAIQYFFDSKMTLLFRSKKTFRISDIKLLTALMTLSSFCEIHSAELSKCTVASHLSGFVITPPEDSSGKLSGNFVRPVLALELVPADGAIPAVLLVLGLQNHKCTNCPEMFCFVYVLASRRTRGTCGRDSGTHCSSCWSVSPDLPWREAPKKSRVAWYQPPVR